MSRIKGRAAANRVRVQQRQEQIAALYVAGKTLAQIAAVVNVTSRMVGYDLAAIRKRWLTSANLNFGDRQAEELARLDDVEKMAREEFEQSKIWHAEDGAELRRAGNPLFLDKIIKCVEARCKILGLVSEQHTHNTTNNVAFNWEQLTQVLLPGPVPDLVEARVLEGLPPHPSSPGEAAGHELNGKNGDGKK